MNKRSKTPKMRCVHKYVPDKPYDPTDEWFSSEGYCEKCNKICPTWWCPKSPNGQCKYDDEEDPCHDSCIYCEMPDERK